MPVRPYTAVRPSREACSG
ncbi:MAG TPA: hypothetical protein ENN63_08360 [Bacteroidetes bacterium]|nr:hypothetical protein [Bacteroidota bacterium]